MKHLIFKIKHCLSLMLIYFFHCFPIKENKIFFFSYYGSQYGCNPKYITEYILNHASNSMFDLVWAFNDPASKKHIHGVKKVKTMSLRYFYELCTSKIIITNFRTTDLFKKRKNQYYIQTWHSSLRLKKIEKDAKESLTQQYIEMAKKDSDKCDLLLSGCKFSTKIFKQSFWYNGEIFEHGTPRNDFLFQKVKEQNRSQIFDRLQIPADTKVILYAPTFRKEEGLDVYSLNFIKILDAFQKKYGGKWKLLIKLHPHLMAAFNQIKDMENVVNVSTYEDIQELLAVADILITDYSSLMFDFAITRRPCFLYVPDLTSYIKNDRDLYFDIPSLPFVHAASNEELIDKIESFNKKIYEKRLSEFLKQIGSYEKGAATEQLVNRMEKICFGEKERLFHEAV